MKRINVRALTECSVMIALSVVLGFIKVADMPYGGSVTPASMLPVLILAYRHGTKWGIGSALVASLLQALLGLKNFSYFGFVVNYKYFHSEIPLNNNITMGFHFRQWQIFS